VTIYRKTARVEGFFKRFFRSCHGADQAEATGFGFATHWLSPKANLNGTLPVRGAVRRGLFSENYHRLAATDAKLPSSSASVTGTALALYRASLGGNEGTSEATRR